MKEIATALLKFHKEVGKIAKGATNPFFNSKYASLSNILDAIEQPLENSELVIVQMPTGENELTTLLIHAGSGELLESKYKMTPVKNDPQSLGSAITYQRRYAIGAILNLNIDEDDDANKVSHPQVETKRTVYPVKTTSRKPGTYATPLVPKDYVLTLKDKLHNLGANSAEEAIKMISDRSGVVVESMDLDQNKAKSILELMV